MTLGYFFDHGSGWSNAAGFSRHVGSIWFCGPRHSLRAALEDIWNGWARAFIAGVIYSWMHTVRGNQRSAVWMAYDSFWRAAKFRACTIALCSVHCRYPTDHQVIWSQCSPICKWGSGVCPLSGHGGGWCIWSAQHGSGKYTPVDAVQQIGVDLYNCLLV